MAMYFNFEEKNVEIQIKYDDMPGCCGVGVFHSLLVEDLPAYVWEGDKVKTKKLYKKIAKKLFEDMRDYGYGIVMCSGVDPTKIVDEDIMYWRDSIAEQKDHFNLYSMAKAVRMKTCHATDNPNTGNGIVTFSKVLHHEEKDPWL